MWLSGLRQDVVLAYMERNPVDIGKISGTVIEQTAPPNSVGITCGSCGLPTNLSSKLCVNCMFLLFASTPWLIVQLGYGLPLTFLVPLSLLLVLMVCSSSSLNAFYSWGIIFFRCIWFIGPWLRLVPSPLLYNMSRLSHQPSWGPKPLITRAGKDILKYCAFHSFPIDNWVW